MESVITRCACGDMLPRWAKHSPEQVLNTLSPKQEAFCREYIVDWNGTQAAIRAGYAPGSAQDQAVNCALDRMEGGTVAEHPRAREQQKS
jgi:D-tyrosyl-tRNA(Tyr) deacylase